MYPPFPSPCSLFLGKFCVVPAAGRAQLCSTDCQARPSCTVGNPQGLVGRYLTSPSTLLHLFPLFLLQTAPISSHLLTSISPSHPPSKLLTASPTLAIIMYLLHLYPHFLHNGNPKPCSSFSSPLFYHNNPVR